LAAGLRREVLSGLKHPPQEEAMFAFPFATVTVPFFHGKPINIWFGIVLAVMISF
jgi:hypothetical protein